MQKCRYFLKHLLLYSMLYFVNCKRPYPILKYLFLLFEIWDLLSKKKKVRQHKQDTTKPWQQLQCYVIKHNAQSFMGISDDKRCLDCNTSRLKEKQVTADV